VGTLLLIDPKSDKCDQKKDDGSETELGRHVMATDKNSLQVILSG